MINLLEIEPNKPSTNLKNFVGLLYGDPGSGKTTLASEIPNNLLIGCELGWKAIPGIHAVPALDMTSMLTILNQLKKPEVKEKYEVVTIDTIDALLHITLSHVLSKNQASRLNDIPWGDGHTQLEQVWKNIIKTIIREGYGLVMIGHRAERIDPEDDDIRYNSLALSNKRVRQYLMSEVDYMTYIESSRDPSKRSIMHFRSSMQWEAKARFPNIVASTELSYKNLVQAISNAIHSVAEDATEERIVFAEKEDEAMSASELATLIEATEAIAESLISKDDNNMAKIVKLRDDYIGKKLSDATPTDGARIALFKEALEQL